MRKKAVALGLVVMLGYVAWQTPAFAGDGGSFSSSGSDTSLASESVEASSISVEAVVEASSVSVEEASSLSGESESAVVEASSIAAAPDATGPRGCAAAPEPNGLNLADAGALVLGVAAVLAARKRRASR